jgi:Predicted membrane protein (DUF2079)
MSKESFRPRARLAGWTVFILWAIGLCLYSTVVYRHFVLAEDFATYNQAWTLIGQGHLNPFDTVYSFPFVRSNFELILWPLGLLHLILPRPIVLLWVQDLSVAGAGLVAYLWALDVLERARATFWATLLAAAAVVIVIVADPDMYQTVGFDVHMEPTAAFFLLLAGRSLWQGRTKRAWVFVACTLLCGTFAAVALVGLGLSALLAGSKTRRAGILVMVTGVAWVALISALHTNEGSGVSNYAYLTGRSSLVGAGGLAALGVGIVTHPLRLYDHFRGRLSDIWILIRPVGVIGLVTAWGFGVPAVVLVTNALNGSSDFITDPFQNFAVFPFVLVGTVIALVWIAARVRPGAVIAVVIGLVIVVQALSWGTVHSASNARWFVDRVGQPQAAQLQAALDKTPSHAEVIATVSVMGRFCARQYCYFFYPDLARPVENRTVVFVLAPQFEPVTSPVRSQRAITYIRDVLHAQVLVDADGIAALEWHAPRGTTEVTIPTLSKPAKG